MLILCDNCIKNLRSKGEVVSDYIDEIGDYDDFTNNSDVCDICDSSSGILSKVIVVNDELRFND